MWDTIGDDLCCLAAKAFSSRVLTESLNQGLIGLIPNNTARDTIGGWKSITLLNVAHKIMAKEMALCIHLVARKVVCQKQTSFV